MTHKLTIDSYGPLTVIDSHSLTFTGKQALAVEAAQLLIRLDHDLLEARAQWNQDWFRRLMRSRPKVVRRLRRRWQQLERLPAIDLGRLQRRHHAHLGGHFYVNGPL